MAVYYNGDVLNLYRRVGFPDTRKLSQSTTALEIAELFGVPDFESNKMP